MHIPSSTYRVQLHKEFTFKDLDKILDYLQQLGISTIYAAPIFTSTPGSMHGYDVTDSHSINPEIGTLADLKSLSLKLKEKGMYWVQDIVPNHMAFSTMNYRLMDVLERGAHSSYYNYFDINWNHHSAILKGKLGVPFLGKELETCIMDGEIKISFTENGLSVAYFDTHYPLSVQAYPHLIAITESKPLIEILQQTLSMATSNSVYVEWKNHKKILVEKLTENGALKTALDNVLSKINNDANEIRKLLDEQNYVFTFWQTTEKEINYRRFFTVNELICLRMEDDEVFNDYHALLHYLYKKDIIQGLRIDHIDGLQDPSRYIRKLRDLFGESFYIIAEKILEAKEEMPSKWPLEGTSGYEFLSIVNQLVTDKKGAKQLYNFYQTLLNDQPSYKDLIYKNKKLILENYMGGEWDNLTHYFVELNLQKDFEFIKVKAALGAVMLSMPVYRIYPSKLPLLGKDLEIINETFKKAMEAEEGLSAELSYLHSLLTNKDIIESNEETIIKFLRRMMQFTGPLTAKGVEDTTFYVYNPLISHDEVGDSPEVLSISVSSFHSKMLARNKSSALSLNATNTHDTKRGEDARMRLNVLSEIPEVWEEHVKQWLSINKKFQTTLNGTTIPDTNDTYFIYQAIVGGFPDNFVITEEWITRLQAYIKKALREAKTNTNWSTPNEDYEKGCLEFARKILLDESGFLKNFLPFVKDIADRAAIYSLTQFVLKCTAPGIPDVYQGCELFDLSFVDPDNRRPVNYEERKRELKHMMSLDKSDKKNLTSYLKENRFKGYEKFFYTWKILNFRKKYNALFINGSYIPLQIAGNNTSVVAYARNYQDKWSIIMAPVGKEIDNDASTSVVLPENCPERWMDVLTGEVISLNKKASVHDMFRSNPVCCLVNY